MISELRAERECLQIRLIFGGDVSVKPAIRQLTETILTLQRSESSK